MCDDCEEEDEQLQLKERKQYQFSRLPRQLSLKIMGLQSGGKTRLTAEARSFFEPRFRRDFSDVRIHESGSAAARPIR